MEIWDYVKTRERAFSGLTVILQPVSTTTASQFLVDWASASENCTDLKSDNGSDWLQTDDD